MMEKVEGEVPTLDQNTQINRRHSFQFLKAFIKSPGSVGAIVPSALELSRAMVRDLGLTPGDTVLELGPGTGAFTVQIRGVLPDLSSYLGIEREAGFVALLENRFPDMRFLAASAEDAFELHQRSGLGPVKAIISSLPFATIPASVRENIIGSVEQLMTTGCVFRTFQYVHAYPLPSAVRFRKAMEVHFGQCQRSQIILPNIPPAFVLSWYM